MNTRNLFVPAALAALLLGGCGHHHDVSDDATPDSVELPAATLPAGPPSLAAPPPARDPAADASEAAMSAEQAARSAADSAVSAAEAARAAAAEAETPAQQQPQQNQ